MREVPFYSQIIDWNGEDSGFPNQAEKDAWESNCCGIACLRMIIDAFVGEKPSYWDLLQEGLARKAYIEAGWIHRGLVEMASDYGVTGKTHRNRSVEDLKASTAGGSLCIVSVTAGFRGGQLNTTTGQPYPKGGHLVVAFDTAPNAIVCHHPSTWAPMNKEYWPVELEAWKRSFSGNYMEFSASEAQRQSTNHR